MQYGHFDDAAREYVIERPDTPTPWSNYLGDRLYGSIITNNAQGYSFSRSPSNGRLLRYSYTLPTTSQPGRTLYLRDRADGDFWSHTWLPTAKPLDQAEYQCRMGTAYIVLSSRYREIETETTYFVPLGAPFEVWNTTITNRGSETRTLDLFSFADFTSEWNLVHDTFNRQYTDYILRIGWEDGMSSGSVCGSLEENPDNFADRDQSRWFFCAAAGDLDPVAWEHKRAAFLGANGSYAKPEAVVQGALKGGRAYGDQGCSAQQFSLELGPGESKKLVILLGVGRPQDGGQAALKRCGTPELAVGELEKLKAHWHGLISKLQVKTPSAEINSTVNTWNAYNALMTFEWSRSCSLIYSGVDRDGYGFRDTVQDFVGVAAMIPERVRERLLLMLSGQESLGGAQPEIDPTTFKPGEMPLTDLAKQRADDCLWFFNAVPAYVAESGDLDFYREQVPYADDAKGDTVFGHLRRALEFNLKYRGAHGLACGLMADWNDCIKLGIKGETTFVTFQLRLGLDVFAKIAEQLGEAEARSWASEQLAELDAAIQKYAWDGEWFLRAFREDGFKFGSKESEEGKIFLNPQAWSVLSGAATDEQARSAMQALSSNLASDYGVALCAPPYEKIDSSVMRAVLMNPGVKENGGIFSHPQGWAVMADCKLGEGDRAFKNLMSYLPAAQNDRIEKRQIEPYVHCQSTHGPKSEQFGTSRVPWLSGTVAWTYHAITCWVLGVRGEHDGLRIDPCIPSDWDGFTMEREFRGKRIHISVENPSQLCKGVKQIVLDNGETIEGSLLALDKITEAMSCRVVLEA